MVCVNIVVCGLFFHIFPENMRGFKFFALTLPYRNE